MTLEEWEGKNNLSAFRLANDEDLAKGAVHLTVAEGRQLITIRHNVIHGGGKAYAGRFGGAQTKGPVFA